MSSANAKIPTLRFSAFSELWDTQTLRDFGVSVIDGDRGKNYPNGDDFTPEGFCVFLNAKNVTRSGFNFQDVMFISDDKDKSLSKGKLMPDDVVLTTRGTVGNIALFDSSVPYTHLRINSGMVILRASESAVSSRFLYFAFLAPPLDGEVKKTAFGSAQPQLTVKGIYALKFGSPTLPEQQKIAHFLTAVDGRHGQLVQKKALLEDYKKGVTQQLFTQAIRFKDDHGNDFPDWEEAPLQEFMVERNTQFPQSETHPLMAFIANKGVAPKGDRYNRDFLVKDNEGKKYKQTEYGDFIYSSNNLESGSIGLNSFGSASISPVYSIFYFKENCNSDFIGRMLLRRPFIYEMTRYRQGVVYGQWRIHEASFLGIKQAVPSVHEQTKIANFLSAIDRKIENVATQITDTQAFKLGLLQQMFV